MYSCHARSSAFCKPAAQHGKYKEYIKKCSDEQGVNQTVRIRGFKAPICEIAHHFIIAEQVYDEIEAPCIQRCEKNNCKNCKCSLIAHKQINYPVQFVGWLFWYIPMVAAILKPRALFCSAPETAATILVTDVSQSSSFLFFLATEYRATDEAVRIIRLSAVENELLPITDAS